jgi:MYXO-CTERM domain-containing protein
MRATQALFDDAAVVTRLYSTLSPAEMTVDPEFDFNPALRMVSNQHIATQVIECSPAVYEWEAPWRVELADGRFVRGTDFTWPFGSLSTMPRNVYVRDMDRTGRGRVVVDNRAAIDAVLDAHNDGAGGPGWEPADPGFAADMGPESDAPSAADVREDDAPGAAPDAAVDDVSEDSAHADVDGADTSGGSAAVGSDPEPAGCQSASGPRSGSSAAWLLGVALALARSRRRSRIARSERAPRESAP